MLNSSPERSKQTKVTYPGKATRLVGALALAGGILLAQGCSTTGAKTDTDGMEDAIPATMENAKSLYQNGKYPEAARMLRKMADKGDPAAQYALGYLRYYGQGVEQNTDMALDWFRLSASKGFPKAREALQRHQLLYSEGNQKPDLDIKTPIVTSKAEAGVTTSPATQPAAPVAAASAATMAPATQAPAPEPVAAPVAKPAPSAPASGSEWLMAQNPESWTIQLISVSKENTAEEFIRKNGLGSQATYFPVKTSGSTIYSVVYGDYASQSAARSGIAELPASVRDSGVWVRSFGAIQKKSGY